MHPTVPGGGHPPSLHPIRPVPAPLDVVAVVSNPARYHSRYRLYRDFARHVESSGARLTTVECAYGERPFEVTDPGNPRHVQLRTSADLWHKENLCNIGISRLPVDWSYVAWVDADVTFADPHWVQETIQALQHHPVVQMWSHAQDLDARNRPIQDHLSFAECVRLGMPYQDPGREDYYYYDDRRDGRVVWHPGFAWAATRAAIDDLGGLLDFAILGSGDRHMAGALIGRGAGTVLDGLHPRYGERVATWEARAERHVRRNLGVVPGLLLHHWHGPKRARGYQDRWKILVGRQYDPDRDVKRDWQGLWALEPTGDARANGLRDDLIAYFKSRDEDSTS